jgi:DnaJ-class molecular chaperone
MATPPDSRHKDPKSCSYCGGKGKTTEWYDGRKEEVDCPHCNGTGQAG